MTSAPSGGTHDLELTRAEPMTSGPPARPEGHAVAPDSAATRGNRFRDRQPEAISSETGTHDLELTRAEPMTS
jgi:hypothetical protein